MKRTPAELLALLFVSQTAMAETQVEAALPPNTGRSEAPARKPERRHGADCQLCYEGSSGLELAIPLWLPVVGLTGERTEGDGSTQRVVSDPQLEFALVAELRLRLGPVGIGLSANGASLGSQVVESGTGEPLGTVDVAAYLGRATLDWYIPPIRFKGGSRTELLAIWPYLGARYALLSGHGSASGGTLLFDGETSWGEPLAGAEFLLDLRRGWLFRLGSDAGGFTVGTEFSVSSSLEARYAVTDWLNFRVGWRLYYARFPLNGSTGTLLLQGPGAGFGVPLF